MKNRKNETYPWKSVRVIDRKRLQQNATFPEIDTPQPTFRLNDSDLVGNIQSIIVGRQSNVRFLLAIGAVKCVDFGHIDIVQLLDGRANLVFVTARVNDKDQCVVIFDLLHSRLSGKWVLDDVVSIHPVKKYC